MKNKIFLFVIIITISFLSCRSFKGSPSPEFAEEYKMFIKEITSDKSLITLERTGCFGPCPTYSLAIYEDGTVAYFGYNFVTKTGLHFKSITPESVDSLVSYAVEMDYYNLLDNYETVNDTIDGKIYIHSVTDLPSEITSVNMNGKRKIVKNYFGGPIWLTYFENKIDSVTDIKNWIRNSIRN